MFTNKFQCIVNIYNIKTGIKILAEIAQLNKNAGKLSVAKKLENKVVKIEEFQGERLAKKILQHSINDYNDYITKLNA